MNNVTTRNRIDRLEQEIYRKENLARKARRQGMMTTYGNYLSEVAWLKDKLQRLRTDPSRLI